MPSTLAGPVAKPTRCVSTLDQLSSLGVLPPLKIVAGRFLGVGPQPFVASRSSAAPMGLSARPALSRQSARLMSSVSAPCWSANDRMMAAFGVRLIPGLMVVQEQFRDAAIRQPRDGHRETQTAEFVREVLGPAPAGEPLTLGHSAASLVTGLAIWSPWQSHLLLCW